MSFDGEDDGQDEDTDYDLALKVTIMSARGLYPQGAAPTAGVGPTCICEVVGKTKGVTETSPATDLASPVWKHEAILKGWVPGEDLRFTVYDFSTKNLEAELVGQVILECSKFHPLPFDGEIRLGDMPDNCEGLLAVKVRTMTPAQARAFQATGRGSDVQAEDEAAQATGQWGHYSAQEVNEEIFEELEFPPAVVQDVEQSWKNLLATARSREAIGEAVYAALFEAAPSLQSLFKTPRAIMAMRFMNGLQQIIGNLADPKALKIVVETLAFQHLHLEITPARVGVFRDAIVELIQVELADALAQRTMLAWLCFLNYVGGAFIYVRVKYTDRLVILDTSWSKANNRNTNEEGSDAGGGDVGEAGGEAGGASDERADLASQGSSTDSQEVRLTARGGSKSGADRSQKKEKTGSMSRRGGSHQDLEETTNTFVPRTYNEMFAFNSAVMGLQDCLWMQEVIASFDAIVCNVCNSYRLQEECDVLSLRMAKYRGTINLGEYKAVMLASLRSLLPKDWDSSYEVAWSWLWENVERMLKSNLGKPAGMQHALAKLWNSLDEQAQSYMRREVYAKFFVLAPAGEDYFKQSTTRLHFIADRLVDMTLAMYREPKKMVEDISALGLRHVGYGIPTDLFGPFVTACVQVVRSMTTDDLAEEAFRWSLGLISRILTRVINEGSTIVMKAINTNSARQLRRAVGCAPRSRRAVWVLNIQVGTQSISPLLWAIENGSLEAAKAILVDLLTIRADRDRYYFGMDTLFSRHPDVIQRLCVQAPALLPTLMDGLVWRSRTAESGQRRVNYYVKHLLVDSEGVFAQAMEWLVDYGDPETMCHPISVITLDTVWHKVAQRTFMVGKLGFFFTICVFVCGQSIMTRLGDEDEPPLGVRLTSFLCRIFIYIFSMGGAVITHVRHAMKCVREGDFMEVHGVKLPAYLGNWQDVVSLLLALFLIAMLCIEPFFHCKDSGTLTMSCPEGRAVHFSYSALSMWATLMYFGLLLDVSVFSTRCSAFTLACGRVLSEVSLFLFGFGFIMVAFASACSALEHDNDSFANLARSLLTLAKITLSMYHSDGYMSIQEAPMLMAAVFLYVILTIVFLINMLVAQLSCAYRSTYRDMLGFARLNRGKIVVDTMPSVSQQRWAAFVAHLRLDERCQFGEGDIGVAGGIQIWEPASLNATTVDMIKRFGGSTAPNAPWPKEVQCEDDKDKFERLEKVVKKAMKRVSKHRSADRNGSSAGNSSMGGSSLSGSSMNSGASSGGMDD